jgi:hypothetical protein
MQGPPSTSDCLPQGYQDSPDTFYLPASGSPTCPPSYESSCASTKSLGAYTVTLEICCPGNFQCQPSPIYEWQTTLGCFSPFTGSGTETITVIASETGTTSITTLTQTAGEAVNAYAIAIQIPNPTKGDPNPTILATASATSSPIQQSSGLNPTTIALICVLAVLVIAILGFVIRFYWTKNRRQTLDRTPLSGKLTPNSASATELRPLYRSRSS